jgi:hypothetical protein
MFCLTGCITPKHITLPLDTSLISDEEATIIIFNDQLNRGDYTVLLDGQPVGKVSGGVPLKISVKPGEHTLNTNKKLYFKGLINRQAKKNFEAGKVYYFRLWYELGIYASSIWIDEVSPRNSYTRKMLGETQQHY